MHPIRDWLAIGKYRDTLNRAYLDGSNVGAMLQLAESVPQDGIVSLYLAVEDGEPLPLDLLAQGVAFIREQKANGHKVLVACGAGISRSSSFALAALKEEEDLDLTAAYREVYARHPAALPHPELWKSLCDYYGETVDFMDAWQVVRNRIGKRGTEDDGQDD